MMTAGCEIAWAAGLFEGEGTITQSAGWPWLGERRRGQALKLAPVEAILLEPTTTATVD
jgi:hypothetical protein